jgi:hypothetical protein
MPARGFFGQLEERVLPHSHTVYLWTHHDFHLQYNGDHIVAVNISETSKEILLPDPVDETATLPVTFTYSVTWTQNDKCVVPNYLVYS